MRQKKLKAKDGVKNKIPLVYIIASSHSGSTLLAMLLNAHPDVCSVGELKATSLGDVDRYRCSCQEKIKECPFWNDITKAMARKGFEFDIASAGTDIRSGATKYIDMLLRPLHRGPILESIRDLALELSPTWRRCRPNIQKVNYALMQCVLERSGKRVLVDSSKIGLRLKYLLRHPELNVKIIRLVRDGRGVSLTYIDPARFADARDPNLRGGGMGGDRASERISIAVAAREWRRSNEEAQCILDKLDQDRWMQVKYEDVCERTDETLAQIYQFIGANPDHENRSFRSIEHHVVGNGMRLDFTCKIRLDNRWKSVLSESDRRIFDSVAGDMNRRLGYS